jgi:transketolase
MMAAESDSEADRDRLGVTTIRTLAMDAVQRAGSGHPGTAMALAPVAFTLFSRQLRFNPTNPSWPNRDRFVLSAGHASMLLYATLHLTGYDLEIEDIKNFRRLHSKCPGHPEYRLTPGVETTTGPLGQGLATSVGLAIAEQWLAAHFNRPGHQIVDYRIYAIAGDGCIMEGVSAEAASLAGHLGLNNLIWIYDNNKITIEGSTDLAFSEDVAARFMAYNWNILRVGDANDLEMLSRAIAIARNEKRRPSLIIVDSHIAYGSPNRQDTCRAHGEPLGEEEIRATKLIYGWDPDRHFHVPEPVKTFRREMIERGQALENEWLGAYRAYESAFPDAAIEFKQIQDRAIPAGVADHLPVFPVQECGLSGREANGVILNTIAAHVPWFLGGSADLAPSTRTTLHQETSFSRKNRHGRNIHFGIREHGMAAILNGLALSGLRCFGSTFLVFSDYLRPSLRLSALMQQPVVYIFTHDSIGVGEDGPTHQPVEHLASMRAIPGIDVIRPADGNELSVMWRMILQLKDRPVVLVLSKQPLPTIDRTHYSPAEGALRGAYILADCLGKPEVILIGTGSEIQLCLGAFETLMAEGIAARVVSMPCWEIFERQSPKYWEEVLPTKVRARVAVEAGSTFGWRRYTGKHDKGAILGVKVFGESAPIIDLLAEFGLTVDGVVAKAKEMIARARKSA